MVQVPRNKQQAQTGPRDTDLIGLINKGDLLPIISGEALENIVMQGRDALIDRYASTIKYDFEDRSELHKLARYRSLGEDQALSAFELKTEFLNVVTEHLIELARSLGTHEQIIEDAFYEAEALKVSEFASRLGIPALGSEQTSPLAILANLPLPIFVTTSPYKFIELALERADKKPRTDYCRWQSKWEEQTYNPTVKEPLVYHLYGIDDDEASLVLTEDDYLSFIDALAQNRGKDGKPIPGVIDIAIQTKPLLLMGFSFGSLSFLALYHGLIKHYPSTKLFPRDCCLQAEPIPEQEAYFERYLRKEAQFRNVYWKSFEAFCKDDLAPTIG